VKKSSALLYWTGTGSDTLSETNLSGATYAEYIYFNGKRVARRDVPGTPTVKYYFSDHLGSASVITNSTGTMPPLEESDYYPYGGEIAVSGSDSNRYKFTGKERDAESGLDYFGARHYASALGRFMIPDWAEKPIDVPYANFGNPQSLNLYSYVKNNPTTFGDPDGHVGPETVIVDVLTDFAVEHPELVDAVVGPLVDSASQGGGGALGSVGGTLLGVGGAMAGAMLNPSTVGQSDANERAAMNRAQQEREQQEPEPQTSTSGAGARKGNGNSGTIYKVPGDATQSGKPYVGRHNQPDPAKTRKANDGRDRTKAEVVDTYDAANTQEGRTKEQQQIDQHGLSNLDNKRNEIRQDAKKADPN
jgi:RHS repeat-associated protein